MSLLTAIVKELISWREVKTNRKLIVFISDDWGSLRIRDKAQRDALIQLGINMELNRFDKLDAFETNDDIDGLFNVLSSYKDLHGRNPVLTAATCLANPDYEKIEADAFNNYYYKPIDSIYKEFYASDKVLDKMLAAMNEGFFVPEFHGREHLNTNWWLDYLKNAVPIFKTAFGESFFMISGGYQREKGFGGIGASFDLANSSEIKSHIETALDGLRTFERIFKQKASCFIAPSLLFNSGMEPALSTAGIKLVDVARFRTEPVGEGKYKKRLHYMGQKAAAGCHYFSRNAVFEPDYYGAKDEVETCLQQVKQAFDRKQPAVISNHRVCFMGGIKTENRDFGLKALDKLFRTILTKWPDAEFVPLSALAE
ncbi:hypothetical protein, partial [Flavihumibacter sp. CACIAM 22H1]|uniref:hypothetical protein n=1 Tax=Flavihumibacter sp. CACIAM 22H1 TaxID=1812911 RepID=UPI0007A8C2BC